MAHEPLIDLNNDKEIQFSEAQLVKTLNLNGKSIANLTGIEAFIALTTLYCNTNQLTILDVSINTLLTELRCSYNQLSSLDVSNNTALAFLACSSNKLTTLDVSKNTALYYLWCSDNKLTTICINTTQKSTGDVMNPFQTTNWGKDDTAEYSTTCNTITGLEDSFTPTSKPRT